MGLEALPVSCIGSGTEWQMYCFFPPIPPPPSSPVHSPPFHFNSPWLGGNCGFFSFIALGILVTSFEFGVPPPSQVLTASFVILKLQAVCRWEYLSIPGRSGLKWAFYPLNTGIPKPLQGFLNGIIAQESRSLALNTLCVRNLNVVNSFQNDLMLG